MSSERSVSDLLLRDWERAAKVRAAVGTFVAITKAAKSVGLHPGKCLEAGNAAAIRHHGVDVLAEVGAQQLVEAPSAFASPMHSVSWFLSDLLDGSWVNFRGALSTDLYSLYEKRCKEIGSAPVYVARFVEQCKRHGLIDRRVRWVDESGEVCGPHTMLLAADVALSMPRGNQAVAMGEIIAQFRRAAEARLA